MSLSSIAADYKRIIASRPSRITMSNSDYVQQPAILEKFKQAINVARSEKERREASKRATLESPEGIFGQIDSYLRGGHPSTDNPPPDNSLPDNPPV